MRMAIPRSADGPIEDAPDHGASDGSGTVLNLEVPRDEAREDDSIERDRTRLAYAIHDGLTQVVTASVLELDWLARRLELRPEELVQTLRTATDELRRALQEIRGMLASLTPTEPITAPPIEDLLRSVLERWQLPATWSVDGDLHDVPAEVLEAAAVVIREGVANVAKHADSRDVAVHVHRSRHEVEVSVEDNGRGFETASGDTQVGHLGLEMLRQRVADARGTLDVSSTPGEGTRVVARLPVTDEGASE
jgi:signal transduction histidine kinase